MGREPSGAAFNSIVQLETENGIPRNPFINAGALVTTGGWTAMNLGSIVPLVMLAVALLWLAQLRRRPALA